jgi:hypothetical protein
MYSRFSAVLVSSKLPMASQAIINWDPPVLAIALLGTLSIDPFFLPSLLPVGKYPT